jgi:hypothetical protein
LDEDRLFVTPVIEAVPDLRKSYTAKIKYPMDFRTIREERIPVYMSIQQLQDDLILVFRNCAIFNGETSSFGAYAM